MPIPKAPLISSIAKTLGLIAGKDLPKISRVERSMKSAIAPLSKFSTTAGISCPTRCQIVEDRAQTNAAAKAANSPIKSLVISYLLLVICYL